MYGFLILSHDGLQTRLKKSWVISLGLALTSTVAIFFANKDYSHAIYGTQGYAIINGLFGITAWLWVVTIFGFGMKYFNINNKFISYANEAVLPFYILHQTVLLCVGFFVTQWQISSPAKFAIISLSSLCVIFVFYEFLIRRINFLRILFGMKPRQIEKKTESATKKPIPANPY